MPDRAAPDGVTSARREMLFSPSSGDQRGCIEFQVGSAGTVYAVEGEGIKGVRLRDVPASPVKVNGADR